jgi:hypothetical protein
VTCTWVCAWASGGISRSPVPSSASTAS